jgi:hypothetical protein
LDLKDSDIAATIYNNIISSGALDAATDPSDPLNAKLVAKPLKGLENHEGGDNFPDLTDADLAKIYCWIASGAANN